MTRVPWCVLGCRQEPPLCAQVIFFPGVSGQGLAFLHACGWCGVGGRAHCFRRCTNVHLESGNTHLAPLEEQWNTLQRCWIWSMFMSALWQWEGGEGGSARCYTTQGTGLGLQRKWGGPGRHPWHSPIIKTRWHGETKPDSPAVFTVTYDCRRGCECSECGRKWAGITWDRGTVREKSLRLGFVWHESPLTATVQQEPCQGVAGDLARCHRETTQRSSESSEGIDRVVSCTKTSSRVRRRRHQSVPMC